MLYFSAGQKSLKHLPYISLLLFVFVLHACGFHLRGALDLSEDISPVYLQKNSAFELAQEIKSLLVMNKISIEENINKAHSVLTLLKEEKSRRVLSVDASGRAKEYLLNYTVKFSIKIKQPEDLKEKELQEKDLENSISLTRSLLFDPDAVLAVTNESAILYKDMQRDAARLILLKLQAHSAKKTDKDVINNNSTSEQIKNIKF
jgi:LPS-assembly lipoprotein